MKVVVDDVGRMFMQSGYGALSRGFLISLSRYSRFKIYRVPYDRKFAPNILDQSELLGIKTLHPDDADVVLRIGSPKVFKYNVPSIFYTQNALADLIPEWVKIMSNADALIVPGEFDRRVFERYFPNKVHTCPQYVDGDLFVPRPTYRKEGTEEFTFFLLVRMCIEKVQT